jgi:hypothetical protein
VRLHFQKRIGCFGRKKALHFSKMMFYNSVHKELFTLFIEFSRTVFLLNSLPRTTFRFVPPSILPRAKLYWPFRPEKNTFRDLCIKSSLWRGLGRGLVLHLLLMFNQCINIFYFFSLKSKFYFARIIHK